MIETPRLHLIPCELSHFEAILNDERKLASLLQVSRLAEDWLGFDAAREAMAPSYEHLKSHPEILGWWTYLFVHKPDRTLIGLGGYKGPVNEGIVEIGYEIAPSYRRRGLALEAAHGMTRHAFANTDVERVEAHTLPERNASTRVLEKMGMKFVGKVDDPQDGEIWRWSVTRLEYLASELPAE